MTYDADKMATKAPAISILAADDIGTGQLVDRYGRLKANAADLNTELEGIKTTLIEREGEGKFEGELFRLALTNSVRSTVDWQAVARAMAKRANATDKVFDNCVAANTNVTPQWVARCSGRVTK